MILTKEVEIKWARTTKQWYENKGYVYTGLGDKFIVKIEDLKGKTKVKVDIRCDKCGEILKNRDYNNIINQRERNQTTKDCCKSCSKKLNIKTIRNLFYHNNYIPLFLGSDYINTKIKLPYICQKHPEETRYITYDSLKGGSGCWECAREKMADTQRMDFDKLKQIFKNKNMTLISDETEYDTRDSILLYICDKHPEISVQSTTYNNVRNCNCTCSACIKENSYGENHPRWNGGISQINHYLRGCIELWKKDGMQQCNYKCIISNERFNVIHHLYGFDKIIEETFSTLNIEIKPLLVNYSIEELENLKDKLLELHYKYGLGVCLRGDIHSLFHKLYGRGNNTPEQFYEFKSKIESGEIILDKVA